MRRRELITLLGGGAVAWPFATRAQQKAMPVIGWLGLGSPGTTVVLAAFRQGLGEAGFVEGQNVAIEYRWAENQYDRLPALAADLVGRAVDVIVTVGGEPVAAAVKTATSAIPIISGFGGDPVEAGLVASLARPGGNLTGFTQLTADLTAKRLGLLSELVPRARTMLVDPNYPPSERIVRDAQEAARVNGISLQILRARSETEIDDAFSVLAPLRADALIVPASPFFGNRFDQLVTLAAHHAVPAIYEWRQFAEAGGLISYGTSLTGMWRQLGVYTGRILNGAKPADLPVQQPTTFELVINLRTAKALGLTIPPSMLDLADEVIE
jgi:putative tryptophan/tyrosine transport system substrate-binding protein